MKNSDDLISYYSHKFEKIIKNHFTFNNIGLSNIEIPIGYTRDMFFGEDGIEPNNEHKAKIEAIKKLKKNNIIEDFKIVTADLKMIALCTIETSLFTQNKNSNKSSIKEVTYQDMILHFSTKDIVISKKDGSELDAFMKTLFNDVSAIWNYDAIADDWSIDCDNYDDNHAQFNNKFYQLARRINEKIGIATNITDFLIYSKKSVQINKKYLD